MSTNAGLEKRYNDMVERYAMLEDQQSAKQQLETELHHVKDELRGRDGIAY